MVTPDFKFEAPRPEKLVKTGHMFKNAVQKVTAMNPSAGKVLNA